MLMYLINVVDNTWVLAVAAPMILYLLGLDGARRGIRRLVLASFGLGLLASAILAALRLNTGWVIREFYDLGVLVPLLGAFLAWIVLSWLALRGLGHRPGTGAARPRPGGGQDAGPPWGLGRPLGRWEAIAVRAFLSLVLAAAISVLLYRLAGTGPRAGLLASLPVLAALLSLGPAKVVGPRIPLAVSGLLALALLTARVAPNLALYPFEFGVGMDSVFNLDYLAKVSGYLAGLAVMALVWLSVRFLARQAPPRPLRWFLLLGLLVLLSQLSLETAQILAARRMLPRPLFSLVLYFLERKSLFLFGEVLVWAALATFLMARARLTVPVGRNPAIKRKMRASLRDDLRAGALLLASMALVIVASTTLRAVNSRGPVISDPEEVEATDGRIRLGLERISDGDLHRHVYQTEEGTPVRFIVIKKSQSAFGVGLDACDICGQSGYYQRGDQVICKLCDVVMNKSTIGFPGGCNPVPLEFSLAEGALLIDPADLEAEVHRFK
jgi:uncharacterized membrane protein